MLDLQLNISYIKLNIYFATCDKYLGDRQFIGYYKFMKISIFYPVLDAAEVPTEGYKNPWLGITARVDSEQCRTVLMCFTSCVARSDT